MNKVNVDKIVESVERMRRVKRTRKGFYILHTVVKTLKAKGVKPGETFASSQVARVVEESGNNIWNCKSFKGLTCSIGDALGDMGLRRRDRGLYIMPAGLADITENDELLKEPFYPKGEEFRALDVRRQS